MSGRADPCRRPCVALLSAAARRGRRRAIELYRDEPLQVVRDPLHHPDLAPDPRHQHRALERRDDEARDARRVHSLAGRRLPLQRLLEQRRDLLPPPREDTLDARPEPLGGIGHLRGHAAERRSGRAAALGLRDDDRVDEEVEPLQRIDQRLAQDREAALAEPLEGTIEDLVAELLLRAEVVVEMALPAEPRRLDDVLDGGLLEAGAGDEPGSGVQDLSFAVAHEREYRTERSKLQPRIIRSCKFLHAWHLEY